MIQQSNSWAHIRNCPETHFTSQIFAKKPLFSWRAQEQYKYNCKLKKLKHNSNENMHHLLSAYAMTQS